MQKTPLFSLSAYLSLALFLSLSACEKDTHGDGHDHTASDTTKPLVSISSPTDMNVYYSGDTVRIKALITDESLHELRVKILKDSDNSELYSETISVHELTAYELNTYWKSHVSNHSNARVIVLAEDHGPNLGSDTVRIHIMP